MLTAALHKRLGDFSLGVSFDLTETGITVIFGKSGSGKTTVLNLLAGLYRLDSGRVILDGTTLADTASGIFLQPEKRRMGYVFQQPRLFSHLSVRSNLLFAPRFCGAGFDAEYFERVIELLGIGHLLKRATNTLSGGESQRVAIGRALMASSKLLLMDEPLASLDQARRDELVRYIDRIPGEFDIPVVYVTHSPDELAALADSVLLLRSGQGDFFKSRGEIPPDILARI